MNNFFFLKERKYGNDKKKEKESIISKAEPENPLPRENCIGKRKHLSSSET